MKETRENEIPVIRGNVQRGGSIPKSFLHYWKRKCWSRAYGEALANAIPMNFIRAPSLSVRRHSRQLASTRQLHIPRLWKITAQQRAGSGSRQPSTDIAVTPPASTSSLLHTSRDRNQLKHPTLHGRGKATTVWGRTEMARAIQEDVERFYLSSPPGLSHGGRKEPLPALCLETGKSIYKLLLPLERSGATRQRSPLKWGAAPQHFPVSGSAGLRAGPRRWQHKGAAGPREETARSSQGWLQQLRPSKPAWVRGTSPTRPARGRGRGFGGEGLTLSLGKRRCREGLCLSKHIFTGDKSIFSPSQDSFARYGTWHTIALFWSQPTSILNLFSPLALRRKRSKRVCECW